LAIAVGTAIAGCPTGWPRAVARSPAPTEAVLFVVSVANVFNLGADIGAMGAATQLVLPGNAGLFIVIFGIASLAGVLLSMITSNLA